MFDYDNNQIGFGSKTAEGGSANSILSQTFVAESSAGSPLHSSVGKLSMYGLGSVILSIMLIF